MPLSGTFTQKDRQSAVASPECGSPRLWVRLVLPSFGDLIFVLLFLALTMGALAPRLLADGGIGWHIRTGQLILDSGAIPHVDSFSSTMKGHPWFAWEWLYDIAVGALDRWLGLNGVVWLGAILIAATFAAVFRSMVARGTNLLVAVVLILLAISASTIHFFARPHIVSWLLVWMWFAILDRWQRGRGSSKALYVLPLLMVLWVNLHGGFVLGLVILGCFWLGEALDAARRHDAFERVLLKPRRRTLGRLLVFSALATLVNPYGYHLHVHIYRYLTNHFLMSQIDEFRSPDFHGAAQKCFAVILLLVLIALARGARLRTGHLLLVVFAVYAGLYASRNLPTSSILLVLIIGPPLSALVSEWWGEFLGGRPTSVSSAIAAASKLEASLVGHAWPVVITVATLVALAGGWRSRLIDAHFDASRFPLEAAATIAQSSGNGPVFAPDYWGGYLIYRLPNVKVVVDDRHDLYGEAFLRKYLGVVHLKPGWNNILDDWKVNRVLMPEGSALANILSENPHWEVVHRDKTAVLFERKQS